MSNQTQRNKTNIYLPKVTQLFMPVTNFTNTSQWLVRFDQLKDNDQNQTIMLYLSQITDTSIATTNVFVASGVPAEFIPKTDRVIAWGVIENNVQTRSYLIIKTTGTIEIYGNFNIGLLDGIVGGTLYYKILDA